MKYRVMSWINTDTFEPFYGLQANIRKGKWAHVSEGTKPLFYATREEAAAKAKELTAANAQP